jgi:hypothetical protein
MRHHPAARQPGERRDGVVLLVVIAMLALFASVGIGFVFYAESEATASQLSRLAVANPNPDSDPELLLSYFLSQLIYDTENPYSAMRGHSLARLMYGYNPAALNFTPFNGTGRLRYNDPNFGVDAYPFINYQKFGNAGNPFGSELPQPRDPEFVKGKYTGGANVGWTSPDLNNMFLALVSANAEVLQPSFRRDWNNAAVPAAFAKYGTLRPHKSYHTLFPDIEDAGGDVRNLDFGKGTRLPPPGNGYANNDSIWMDLGHPVMTAPNGKRYKPLFAPLIVDLDSRINLWATGNNKGAGTTHVSNQGYGATEINIGLILTDATERQNFLNFRNATLSGTPAGMRPGRYYSLLDFDGLNNTTNTSSGRLALPSLSSFSVAPTYPAGWDNVNQNATSIDERLKHPLSQDFMKAVGSVDAKPFSMANMEALMRFMGRNSPAVTSELFKRMPNTLANGRNRNLMTLMSWHFDRIAAPPFLTTDPAATTNYRYDAAKRYAAYTPVASPDPTNAASVAANSEYGADWRSTLGKKLRINLNRTLADYPLPDPTTFLIDTSLPAFTNAENDRITMARDLYAALLAATGAQDPNKVAGLTRATLEFQAARWLAQLAVNIVDYIDNDDYMTTYLWYTNPDPAQPTDFEYVHGTEMPRLVLNEAYAQFDNDAQDKGILDPLILKAQDRYLMNFWIELLNPHNTTPTLVPAENYPLEQGRVRLQNTLKQAIYQIVVVQDDAGAPTYLRTPDNVRGDPDPAAGKILTTMDNWDETDAVKNFVEPANGTYEDKTKTNVGFYVVGPVGPDPAKALFVAGRDPQIATTYKSNKLSVSRALGDPLLASPTVVLRRLANPHLPLQATPGKNYNPYITVDYIQKLPYFDGRVYDDTGVKAAAPAAVTTFTSYGRNQPFAATSLIAQNPINPLPGQPKHTFHRHNAIDDAPPLTTTPAGVQTLQDPFDWLVHLDRPVVNSLELLHVSCYKPHELTQEFNGAAGKFGHRAAWMQPESLLYRLVDLAGSPPQLAGTTIGGKQPGRINLNTMLEWEVFQALCDPRDAAELATAKAIFTNLITSRGYGVDVNQAPNTYALPTNDGRPFKNFATGFVTAGDSQYPNGAGMQDTLLRTTNPGELLFAPGITSATAGFHPTKQLELAQKIFNNTTTVSNVFGVWVTVGFFEVVDESVSPAKLGAELGRDESRHVRHRMFAIVDRSELKLFNTTTTAAITAGTNVNATLAQSNGTMPNGKAWSVQPGMLLEINSTGGSEVVVVQGLAAGGFTANYTLTHPAGATVIGRGNPGPQTRYNPRSDTAVVPHFSVIE